MNQLGTHDLTENVNLEEVRRSVTYHPTIWGDYFLAYASNHIVELSTTEQEELQNLKEEARNLLSTTPDDSLHKLEVIDAIQRLGVGYHFEKEIGTSLKHIYDTYLECNGKEENDLHMVALRFRLLRQQGYNVSSDMFNKFIDHEGKYKELLMNNVQGILSLYETAHFGVHGEQILDEALVFSRSQLQSKVFHMSNNSLVTQINEALKIPIRKSLTRLGAAKFMSMYQADESHNGMLINFAKLDFNFVQKIHQKELSDITRWWKALDFKNKLPFARDRMVECYFWALGIYFEPQFSLARKILSKVIVLASTIDDIYDVYGTLGDLQLFTDAIQRWDIAAMEQLPPYMRICYEELLNVYTKMQEVEESDKPYRAHYAKEEMKKLVKAYFQEAEWFYNSHIPTFEEYMKVATISFGYVMGVATSLVGMGNLVLVEDFDWVARQPLIVQASTIIARLMDDMAGHGFEKKFSAVECYMNRSGASKKEAFDELHEQVSKAWKDINQECLYPTVSMPVLMRIVNSTCVIHLFFTDGDGYTNSKTEIEDLIKQVLVEPVTI